MKKSAVCLFGFLALASALFVIGCFTEEEKNTPTISAWEMKSSVFKCETGDDDCIAGETVTISFPIVDSMDMDGDGTIESISMSSYISLNNNVFGVYVGLAVTDGGIDTTTLASYGIKSGIFNCSTYDSPYTRSGDIYTVFGEDVKIIINGNTMTMTDPAEISFVSTLTKTEINPTENCTFFEEDSLKKDVKNKSASKIYAQKILKILKKQVTAQKP